MSVWWSDWLNDTRRRTVRFLDLVTFGCIDIVGIHWEPEFCEKAALNAAAY